MFAEEVAAFGRGRAVFFHIQRAGFVEVFRGHAGLIMGIDQDILAGVLALKNHLVALEPFIGLAKKVCPEHPGLPAYLVDFFVG